MTDKNISMTLSLADLASPKLQGFLSLLKTMENSVGSSNNTLANFSKELNNVAASLEKTNGALKTFDSGVTSSSQGISSFGASAKAINDALNGMASVVEKVSSTLKMFEESVIYAGRSVASMGSSAMVAANQVSNFAVGTTLAKQSVSQFGSQVKRTTTGLLNMGTQAKQTNDHISKMHEALLGMYATEASHKIVDAEKESLNLAGQFEAQKTRLEGRGLNQDQISQFVANGSNLQSINPRLNDTESLALHGELQKLTNSTEETIKVAGELAKFYNVLEFYTGHKQSEQDRNNWATSIEQMGGMQSEAKLKSAIQMVVAQAVESQGTFNAEKMLTLTSKYGGTMRGMSEEGQRDTMAYMSSVRGGAGATALRALDRFSNGRALTTQDIEFGSSIGLISPEQLKKKDNGTVDVTRTKQAIASSGGVLGADVLRDGGLIKWFDSVLTPLLMKNYKNPDGSKYDPTNKENRDVALSQLKGSDVLLTLLKELGDMGSKYSEANTLGKTAAGAKAVLPYDELQKKAAEAPSEKWKQFVTAMERLGTTLGETVLPAMTKFINILTQGVNSLNSFSKDHPSLAFFVEVAGAVVAATLAFAGWLAIIGQFDAALTILMLPLKLIPALIGFIKIAVLDVAAGFPLLIAAASSAWASMVAGATTAFAALKTAGAALMSTAGLIGIFIVAAAAIATIFLFPDTIGNFEIFGVDAGKVAKNITAGIQEAFDFLATSLSRVFNWILEKAGVVTKAAADANDASLSAGYNDRSNARAASINDRGWSGDANNGQIPPMENADPSKPLGSYNDPNNINKAWSLEYIQARKKALASSGHGYAQTNSVNEYPSITDLPSGGAPIAKTKKATGGGAAAAADRREANSESENAKFERDKLAIELKATEQLYRDHQISIEEMFKQKVEFIKNGYADEIAALEKEKQVLEKDPVKNSDKINKVDHQLIITQMKEKQALLDVEMEKKKALQSLDKEGLTIQEKLENITKSASNAKIAMLDEEYNKKRKILELNGQMQAAENLSILHVSEVNKVRYDDEMKQMSLVKQQERTLEMQAQSDRKKGLINTADMEQQIVEAKRQLGEQELINIARAEEFAAKIGDPAIIESIKQMKIEAQDLADTLDAGAQKFKDSMQGAIEGGLNDLMNGKFSFKKFADSIVQSINKQVAKSLSETITNGLFGSSKDGKGGLLSGLMGDSKSGEGNFLTNLFGGSGKKSAAPSGAFAGAQGSLGGNVSGDIANDPNAALAASAKNAEQGLKDFTKNGVDASTNSMVKGITQDTMEQSTSQQATQALQQLAQAAQQAAQALQQVGSGGGGGGGGFGGMSDFFGGGASGDSFSMMGSLMGFDVGADSIPRDMIAKIHKGEMILPADTAERVRNGMSSGGGAATPGMNVVNNFHMTGAYDKRTQSQIAKDVGGMMQKSIRRDA
jgi:hypothetical protein